MRGTRRVPLRSSVPAKITLSKDVPLGSPCVYVDMQLEIKPGTKKKKKLYEIKQYLQESAALSIYAPLRRFPFKKVPLFNTFFFIVWLQNSHDASH